MLTIQDAEKSMQEAVSFLQESLQKVRAGRANPDLVKGIKVNAYNSQMPVEQLANINVADPTLLTVQPWDKSLVQEIVKAIQSSDIGITPSVDGDLIRLPIPPMTTERREEYVKLVKQKAEEARISIRQRRKDFLVDLGKQEGLSEDEVKRLEKQLQDIVDDMNDKVEEIGQAKEQELMQI